MPRSHASRRRRKPSRPFAAVQHYDSSFALTIVCVERLLTAGNGRAPNMTRKTTEAYWDEVWAQQRAVPELDPRSRAVTRQFDRVFDREVRAALRLWGGTAGSLVEVGCGGSCYLPYFARHHGLCVSGLDYSEAGCANAARALVEQGVTGEIRRGDMFAPPAGFGSFDVACSIGLLEHFQDTAAAVKALSRLVRPGGLVLSLIPNMTGLTGLLQKWTDRPVYDLHVPLDAGTFAAAHTAAGLEVLVARPMMTLNLYVVSGRFEALRFGTLLRYLRAGISRACWAVEFAAGREFPNGLTSPYIFCAARVGSEEQRRQGQ